MRGLCCWTVLLVSGTCVAEDIVGLSESLVFHAAFDDSVDADFAKGDRRMYTAESLKRAKVHPGLHSDAVQLTRQNGRFGGALTFHKKSPKLVFYQGAGNVAYAADRFQGTIAFWMRLDPESDLPPGYVDPLQITDKKWNDASFFVDFTKDKPRQFRLGVFSDYKFWNPNDRKWDAIPVADRPMVHVKKLPFTKRAWTHVAFSYDGFNRTTGPGSATLYLDGKPQGKISGKQRFSWSPNKLVIMLGINYVGGLDDLAVFNRALSAEQLRQLLTLSDGVKMLY